MKIKYKVTKVLIFFQSFKCWQEKPSYRSSKHFESRLLEELITEHNFSILCLHIIPYILNLNALYAIQQTI